MPPPPAFNLLQPVLAPETNADARTRHLEQLCEIAELSRRAARIATDRIDAAENPPNSPDPRLTLARAMHATRQAIALEHRLRNPVAAARPVSGLNLAIRDKRRAEFCRFIDERLDVELLDDPDCDLDPFPKPSNPPSADC